MRRLNRDQAVKIGSLRGSKNFVDETEVCTEYV